MQHVLGLGLLPLGQLVQDVRGLVHPAALAARLGPHLRQRLPKAQGAIRGRQLRLEHQAATLTIQQQRQPRLLRFAIALADGDHLLGAVRRGAHQHQDALAIILQANVEVDAVGPHVHVALLGERALAPLLVLFLPDALEARDRRC